MRIMFNIKRKGKEKVERFHQGIKEHLSPIIMKCGERMRFGPRIRIANIWAKRHPKRLMLYYSCVAVLLFGLTILIDGITTRKEETDILGLNSIPSMSHRLQSLNNTEIKNERIRQEIGALGLKGMELYNELDSLMKLPVKTHADSIRIINNYNILKNTFNANGHEL